MDTIWTRIETWLDTNAPDIRASLSPGASELAIAEAEKALGVTLPEDVKESYRVHDGQVPGGPALMPMGEFLALDRIVEEWKIWKDLFDSGDFKDFESEPDEGVKKDWWNPAWIPLTYDGAGDHDCLDLDPAKSGKVGQMIEMWHDDGERPITAPSFKAWMEKYADGLEKGDLVVSDEVDGIARKEDVGQKDE